MTLVMDGSFLAQTGKVRVEPVTAGAFDEAVNDRRIVISFRVGEDRSAPSWFDEFFRRLLIAYEAAAAEGWRPITGTAITSALQALRKVMSNDSLRPSVTPTPEGGLQFEWHDAGWDLEMEVAPDGTVDSWGEHLLNGVAFDGPLVDTADSVRIALKDIILHHRGDAG